MTEQKSVRVKVPGTTANCGPGFDTIGIACNIYNELELTLKKDGPLVIEVTGEGAENIPCDGRNIVWRSIQHLLRKAKLNLMREQLTRVRKIGKWQDRWALHPLSEMREPSKLICWLTDIEPQASDPEAREDQLNHHARLHLKASVTEVDRFFMQVRRALTMAERGVVSASSDRRLWFGKNAYNPAVLVKLLEVFRTYFNYCEVGQDKKTPAMRMGLARGPVAPEDILYFEPAAPAGQRRRRCVGTVWPHSADTLTCSTMARRITVMSRWALSGFTWAGSAWYRHG